MNCTIIKGTQAMLSSSGLPKQFWAEAASIFIYLSNRCTNATSKVTPFELWHGKTPDVSHLQVFGCLVYIYVPKEKRQKLDPRATKGILLGYDGAGYRIWNLAAKCIVITRDIILDEAVKGWTGQQSTRIERSELEEPKTSEPGTFPVEVSGAADRPLEIEQLDSEDDDTIILKQWPPSENSRSAPQTPA